MNIPRAILNKMFMSGGKFSKMKAAGVGMNAYFGISEYQDDRAEGHSVASSALSAAGDIALGSLVGMPMYLGLTLAPTLARGAVDAYDSLSQYSRQLQRQRRNVPFQNATFVDSQQTYTMRQAGMNLARQGQMAAQQTTMGNEASSISYMGR